MRFDVADAYVEEFERWYPERHGPDLLKSGFLSAQLYSAMSGGPRFLTAYDVESDVFGSTEYAAARKRDTQLDEAEGNIFGMTKGVFEVRSIHGGFAAGYPTLTSTTVSVQAFDAVGIDPPSLVDTTRDLPCRQLLLGRLIGLHPLFPDLIPPKYLLISTWDDAVAPLTISELVPNLATEITNISSSVSRKVFEAV